MGNRAVITTPKKDIGVYLHWHGSRKSIEDFLAYCDMKGYRSPEIDEYGSSNWQYNRWNTFCWYW